MEFVRDYFYNLIQDSDLTDLIISKVELKNLESGTTLLEAGERTDDVCLVVSGLVRGFYIDDLGNDITKCFAISGDWCCTYNYFTETVCPFYLETTIDTVIARFHIGEVRKVISQYPVLEEKIGKLLTQAMLDSEARILSFTALEAKDRYVKLCEEQPELIRLAKQEHIASYLGVTQSSLSRIKRNL